MQSDEGILMCRRNARRADPENAADCVEFVREPGSDDELIVWFDGAWVVDNARINAPAIARFDESARQCRVERGHACRLAYARLEQP